MPGEAEVRKAFFARRWREATRLADANLEGLDPTSKNINAGKIRVLPLAAVAHKQVGNFEISLRYADDYRKTMLSVGMACPADFLLHSRVYCLAGLGRVDEARRLLALQHQSGADKIPSMGLEAVRSALGASGQIFVDPNYSGKFSGQKQMEDLVRRIKVRAPAAIERIQSRMGNPQVTIPDFVFRLVDGTAGDSPGIVGSTIPVVIGGRSVAVVAISTEGLMGSTVALDELLGHEMAHGVLRSAIRAFDLPDWLSEGVAEWMGGTPEQELRQCLAWTWVRKSNLKALEGVEAPQLPNLPSTESELAKKGWPSQMAAGLLALREAERAQGVKGVGTLIREFLSGVEPDDAFRKVLGSTAGEILARAVKSVPELAPSLLDGLSLAEEIRKYCREGKWDEALKVCEKFHAAHAEGPLQAVVGQVDVEIRLRCGDLIGARKRIDTLQRMWEGEAPLGWFRRQSIALFRKTGQDAELVERGREVLLFEDCDTAEERKVIEDAVREAEGRMADKGLK